jgi:hypothetical protein
MKAYNANLPLGHLVVAVYRYALYSILYTIYTLYYIQYILYSILYPLTLPLSDSLLFEPLPYRSWAFTQRDTIQEFATDDGVPYWYHRKTGQVLNPL